MRFHGKIWQWHLKLSTTMCTAWFEVRLKDGRICKDELERVLARHSNHDVKTHVRKRCKKTRSSLKNLMLGELFSWSVSVRSWQDLTRSELPGDVEPGLHQEGFDEIDEGRRAAEATETKLVTATAGKAMDENEDGEIDYEDWKSVKSCESMCVYYVYLAIRLPIQDPWTYVFTLCKDNRHIRLIRHTHVNALSTIHFFGPVLNHVSDVCCATFSCQVCQVAEC